MVGSPQFRQLHQQPPRADSEEKFSGRAEDRSGRNADVIRIEIQFVVQLESIPKPMELLVAKVILT